MMRRSLYPVALPRTSATALGLVGCPARARWYPEVGSCGVEAVSEFEDNWGQNSAGTSADARAAFSKLRESAVSLETKFGPILAHLTSPDLSNWPILTIDKSGLVKLA